MQTKDIIKQPLTTEWVVASPNAYVHKSERTVGIPKNKSLVVRLVNYNTYAPSGYSWNDANHPSFTTTNSDRTKRFLVVHTDGVGDVYRVVDAKDFVGTKQECEKSWAVQAQAQADAELRKSREDAEYLRLQEQAKATEESLQQAVKENILALFGNASAERINGHWVSANVKLTTLEDGTVKGRIEPSGEVRIPVEEFLRLAERLANA